MRRAFVVLVVSHYIHDDILLQKNSNNIFEFVKVMSKESTVGPFFPDTV